MNCSPQLNDRARSRRPKPSEGRAFTARGVGSAALSWPCAGARFAAESRQFSALCAAPPMCTPDSPLCYSPLPFRTTPAGPLRRGFSRGFGGVPKGFSGIKHRHNERELAAMRLTIERAALLRALGHVQSVVERRNTIPILSNVLLRAEDGQLSLSATDMDLEIVASVAAQGARKGAATAPAHTLYDIVRKLRPGAQNQIQSAGDTACSTGRAGPSTFALACLPPEDYPLMAGGELAHG